jgi:hypothetical protein
VFIPTNCVALIGESSVSVVARDVGERLPFFWDTTLSSGSSVTDVSTQHNGLIFNARNTYRRYPVRGVHGFLKSLGACRVT